MEAVQALLSYLSEKKQQTTIQTLLKMSRLPTKAPKTFENFDFSLLKGRDVERLKVLGLFERHLLSPQTWPLLARQAQAKRIWLRLSDTPAASMG